MGRTTRYRVRERRVSAYCRPISLRRGQVVHVGEDYKGNPLWPGWTWCETASDKCWAPSRIVEKQGKKLGVLKEDYAATELSVEEGEIIEAERELNGWVWGKKPGSEQSGWVPLEILEEEAT